MLIINNSRIINYVIKRIIKSQNLQKRKLTVLIFWISIISYHRKMLGILDFSSFTGLKILSFDTAFSLWETIHFCYCCWTIYKTYLYGEKFTLSSFENSLLRGNIIQKLYFDGVISTVLIWHFTLNNFKYVFLIINCDTCEC